MRALFRTSSFSLICLCLCIFLFLPTILSAEEPVFIVKSTKSAPVDSAFAKLLSEAKEAQKKANSVGGEWRDVGKFLAEAEKYAKEGDLDKANKLAQKAKSQCELGYEQAVRQEGKVEQPLYLK